MSIDWSVLVVVGPCINYVIIIGPVVVVVVAAADVGRPVVVVVVVGWPVVVAVPIVGRLIGNISFVIVCGGVGVRCLIRDSVFVV